jgi:transcriptional regulator with XRE-family HTH domain
MAAMVHAARHGVDYLRGRCLTKRAALPSAAMPDLAAPSRVGALLREWRRRRRLSQLDLALEAGVSARHLSFLETGRSRPSAEMVLHLADQLEVPLRDRNQLLLAAGHAPVYGQRGLEEPEMGPVREMIERVLSGHEPYPAVVVDRHWGMVAGNHAVALLTEGVAPHLLEPPVNVLRATLHPDGMAPRIENLPEWRAHLLERLGRQAVVSGDPALAALHEELASYPGGPPAAPHDPAAGEIAVPLRVRTGERVLAFISTLTTFGTAVDVTVSELSIESFFPADPDTADALREQIAGA